MSLSILHYVTTCPVAHRDESRGRLACKKRRAILFSDGRSRKTSEGCISREIKRERGWRQFLHTFPHFLNAIFPPVTAVSRLSRYRRSVFPHISFSYQSIRSARYAHALDRFAIFQSPLILFHIIFLSFIVKLYMWNSIYRKQSIIHILYIKYHLLKFIKYFIHCVYYTLIIFTFLLIN